MTRAIIIVAGGSGSRMGADIPKQFITLAGKPVLLHTVRLFASFRNMKIVLVLPEAHFETWNKICQDYDFNYPVSLVPGGKTRYESVKNGLDAVQDADFIGVHDGVRPLVSRETIIRCFEDAATFGSAIPVLPSVDSVRILDDNASDSHVMNRNRVLLVQTPQVFRRDAIWSAYNLFDFHDATDDASVVQSAGYNIHLCQGNRENIKLTTPTDLVIAEAFIKAYPNLLA
ncbi:MAG: 2-C-methyl-D-erythritol 4-phosphate cytidylyltransferase [Bacteroidales bacterium]|nr:2-C-methyl-D-erythritol 4-phosphate cytidylyltransferase [Bacteroidales bacterium]